MAGFVIALMNHTRTENAIHDESTAAERGAEPRCEFLGVNMHPHATVMPKKDYSKLGEEDRKKIRDEFRGQIVNVQVIGAEALSNPDGVILGLEIKQIVSLNQTLLRGISNLFLQ